MAAAIVLRRPRHPWIPRPGNVNPKVIQARPSHATISEAMDTYGHLFLDAEDLGRGHWAGWTITGVSVRAKKSRIKM